MGVHRAISLTTLLALLSLLVLPGPVEGRDTDEDFQTWGIAIITGSVAPNSQTWKPFRYWMEGQGRFGNDSSRFSQAVIRPALGYAVNDRTSLWIGGDWVPTSRPFALRDDFNEYRSWQQVLWSDHLSFGTVSSAAALSNDCSICPVPRISVIDIVNS